VFGPNRGEISVNTRAGRKSTIERFDPVIGPTNCHTKIAIVDDDIFIREAWELFLQDFTLFTFDSPETFLLAINRNSQFLDTIDAIVLDYDFGTRSRLLGTELGHILRPKTNCPIIISTDRSRTDIIDIEKFDLHLDKNILDWHNLKKLIPIVVSQYQPVEL